MLLGVVEQAGEEVVLVVEDRAMQMLLAPEVLRSRGFRSIRSDSAADARKVLVEALPDAILMDLQLPGEEGLSFTRELKAREETASIPVIALTARDLPEDQRLAREAGCDDYIAKPVDIDKLAEKLRSVLDQARG
jgi:two-component system cell cycle response regulator DivK